MKSILPLLTLLAPAALCLPGPAHGADKDHYPLKKCIVSGEVLGGDMGKPVEIKYKGETILLCCKSCVKKFNASPEKYFAVYKAELQKK